MKLWHYTSRDRLFEIIESGEIYTTKSNVTGAKESATVWISANPIWEKTATKLVQTENGEYYRLTKQEQHQIMGLGRIEINPTNLSIFSWQHFAKHIAAKRHIARDMEVHGRQAGGNPNQWFGSTKPIPKEHFISAEVWDGNEWQVIQSEF